MLYGYIVILNALQTQSPQGAFIFTVTGLGHDLSSPPFFFYRSEGSFRRTVRFTSGS
jgi:hypothetical protein